MKRNKFIIVIAIMLALVGCSGKKHEKNLSGIQQGLFSWSDSAVLEQGEELFGFMEREQLDVLYQHFSKDLEVAEIRRFLKRAANHDIQVYYLTGDARWALEGDGASMKEQVKRAEEINRGLAKEYRLQGIMMDTEPYLLPEWKKDEAVVMTNYLSAMKEAKKEANRYRLKYIACIPFYYDSKGYEKQLEELVSTACDGLAVMNYSKYNEAEQIRTEMQITEKYECPMIVIYELQKPGKHGLLEENTYYREGIPGVRESVKKLEEVYGEGKFSFALHDYNGVLESLP